VIVLRWRKIPPQIVTRWRGPAPGPLPIGSPPPRPIAAIIGPPGPPGAAPSVIDGGTFQ